MATVSKFQDILHELEIFAFQKSPKLDISPRRPCQTVQSLDSMMHGRHILWTRTYASRSGRNNELCRFPRYSKIFRGLPSSFSSSIAEAAPQATNRILRLILTELLDRLYSETARQRSWQPHNPSVSLTYLERYVTCSTTISSRKHSSSFKTESYKSDLQAKTLSTMLPSWQRVG